MPGRPCPPMRPGAAQTHDMSFHDEVSVCGAGLGPEGGQQADVCPVRPGAPRAPVLGPDMGAPRRGEGEGEGVFADPVGLESERQVMEAGGPELWGCQGRLNTPADDQGYAVDSASRRSPQSAVNIVQQLTDRAVRGVWTNRSPESCAAEVSALWVGLQAGARGRGAPALMCLQSQPASTASLHLGGPEGGRAWGNPKIGSRSRMKGTAGRRWPSEEGAVGLPTYPESSDEFSEIQLMRMSPYLEEGGQAKPHSPEDPGDTPRHINFHTRVNFLHMPASFLSSAAQAFTLAVERQAVGELDFSSSKKMQSVVWHKGGNRRSYQAAAAAAAGGLATSRRKSAQEKESVGGASQVVQGRTFPSWGQRGSATPLDPATFPPISGVPLLGSSKKYSFARAGTQQSKDRGTGRKSVARRTRESEPVAVAGEDDDPKRDPATQAQPPAHRSGPCCPCTHRGEGSHGDLTNRAPQLPESSQPLAMLQGDLIPRGSAPSGDQEPLDHPPRPEKKQQEVPGAQGCPRCLMLQRVIDDLKEQLAAMQSLADKFQSLGS